MRVTKKMYKPILQAIIICDACHKPIEKDQFVYEFKLDDGTIKQAHGGKCTDVFAMQIKRMVPIVAPDWWIRQVPNPLNDAGSTEQPKVL